MTRFGQAWHERRYRDIDRLIQIQAASPKSPSDTVTAACTGSLHIRCLSAWARTGDGVAAARASPHNQAR